MPSWRETLIIVALVLVAAYQFKDSDFVKETVRRAVDLANFSHIDSGAAAKPATNGSVTLDFAKGLHKCRTKTETVYTSDACPPGSREIPIRTGSVSIVPATPVPAPAKGDKTDGRPPNVRDLLLQADDENLRAKQMDAVIGK